MGQTIGCVAVVLGSLLLTGIPAAWLLKGRKPLAGVDFLLAPFLGIAVILLVVQNLVYHNVPIKWSTPFLWVAVAGAWIGFWRSGQARSSFRHMPWLALAAALAVYLVQGQAMLLTGAREYSGRAWSDEYNYVALAQYLCDMPFHTSWADLGNQPYPATGLLLRWDRIGQSILHGFFAATAGCDARTLFGPTILLSPALTVLAMVLLARGCGVARWPALLVGVAAGLLPALTELHLDCFLSHALGLPFLLVFVFVLARLAARGGWKRLGTAALVFMAACSIYTEYWIILQALVVLAFCLCLARPRNRKALLLHFASLSILVLLLNPGTTVGFLTILRRLDFPMGSLFPWAESAEGLTRLWAGDLAVSPRPHLAPLLRMFGMAATVLGSLGLCKFWLDCWRSVRRRQQLVLATCVLALAGLPLAVLIKDAQHPYQFYKLLLSISPLLVLGLALLWQGPRTAVAGWIGRWRWQAAALTSISLMVILTLAAAGTRQMVLKTDATLPQPRSQASVLLAADVQAARAVLEDLPPSPLLLVTQGGYGPLYNAWFSYFGRRHRIWLASPDYLDIEFVESVPENSLANPLTLLKTLPSGRLVHPLPLPRALDLATLPADALVLEQTFPGFTKVQRGDTAELWKNGLFCLWKSASGRWAVPLRMDTPYEIEHDAGGPFFWMGTEATKIEVLARCPGTVTLTGNFRLGPVWPSSATCRLQMRIGDGQPALVLLHEGSVAMNFPVPAGKTTIRLAPWDRPVPLPPPQPGGDPRTLLVNARDLSFAFTPGAEGDEGNK